MTDDTAGVSGDDLLSIADALFEEVDREERAMAYLRGNNYVWSDGNRVHVWVRDGYDGWRDSGWAAGELSDASGVAIDWDVMDEFVMMRFAELVRDRIASAAAERAIRAHRGNGGCVVLAETWIDLSGQVAALEG
jgi:hypothetical protein